MKLFKKGIAILAIMTMSLGMVACGSSKATTEMASKDEKGLIVARVGEVPIYKTALENELARYGMSEQYMGLYYGEDYTSNQEVVDQYNAFKENVIDSLVEAEILVLKAKEMKEISVTEDEINEQLEATKAGFTNEEEFNTALEQSGMTLEDLKDNIEKNLYVTKLIEYYAKNDVKVEDSEVEAYYKENPDSFKSANIYHILVDSEEKANEVLDKYNAGTSFADLAAEYGTDGTASTGGLLGEIPYDTTQYDADFMAGAKALGEGEVSKPVKTQFGWHIIKVDGIKEKSFDEAKEEIRTMLEQTKAEEVLTAKLDEWTKEYEVTRYEDNYKTQLTEAKEETTTATDGSATTENTESTATSTENTTNTNNTTDTTNTTEATPAQ
ncbi:MAG: hypothetical protein E7231_06935 [Cellulosilyticum sp.]|nr:hypothetical protein [Cellulosilyticum sp.]